MDKGYLLKTSYFYDIAVQVHFKMFLETHSLSQKDSDCKFACHS